MPINFPKFAKICQNCPKIAQKSPNKCPKKCPKQSVKNFFWQSVKNLLRTFFETVRSKIRPSKKSVFPFVQKFVRHKKGRSVWGYVRMYWNIYITKYLHTTLTCFLLLLNVCNTLAFKGPNQLQLYLLLDCKTHLKQKYSQNKEYIHYTALTTTSNTFTPTTNKTTTNKITINL